MPTLKSTTVKKSSSADDTVNIIMVGWPDAWRLAQGIIGQNKDSSLKLWNRLDVEAYIDIGILSAKSRLEQKIKQCQTPHLVLFFYYHSTIDFSSDNSTQTIGFTISDLMQLFDHSILSNVVLNFYAEPSPLFYKLCKDEYVKFDYLWKDIDPELVSKFNIPMQLYQSTLTHIALVYQIACIDWPSPFWDTCFQRMTESAQHALANADRIKLATSGETRKDDDEPLHEQVIFYVPGPNTSKLQYALLSVTSLGPR